MPVFPSYRNQSINLQCKSIDWFQYDATIALNGLTLLLVHMKGKTKLEFNNEDIETMHSAYSTV